MITDEYDGGFQVAFLMHKFKYSAIKIIIK